MKILKALGEFYSDLRNFIKNLFSSSDDASMKRFIAFWTLMYLLYYCSKLTFKFPQLHEKELPLFVIQTLAWIIGGALGFTSLEKIVPNAHDWVKNLWNRRNKTQTTEDTTEKDPPIPPSPKPSPLPKPPVLPMGRKEAFVSTLYPEAITAQKATGFNAIATLTQAALETGWKLDPPGNMYFGIKATKNTPENQRQLLTTTEILDSPNHSFPQVLSVSKLPSGKYRYKVKDWFVKYENPSESFIDRTKFFERNPRYAVAVGFRHDPHRFFKEIAAAGYATDPDYAEKLINISNDIMGIVKKLNLEQH